MRQRRSFQCPSCGASVPPSGREGQPLMCPYCNTLFSPEKSRQPATTPHPFFTLRYWVGCLLMTLFVLWFAGDELFLSTRKELPALDSPQRLPSAAGADAPSGPAPTPERATTPQAKQEYPLASFVYHSTFVTQLSSTWILGEVTNISKIPIAPPQVVAILLDENGKEMQTFRGYPPTNRLEPGEKSPIMIVLDHPPKYQSLAFETTARKADTWFQPADGLTLEPNPTRQKQSLATLEGKIRHQGDRPAQNIRVLGVAYAADGRVLSLSTSVATPSSLQPGEYARYQLTLVLPKERPTRTEAFVMAQSLR